MGVQEYFRSDVPEGRSGDWTIKQITIPERDYDRESDPRPDCFKFRPGAYKCLSRNGTQFMTDLYDEWFTQRDGINEAVSRGGNILITGLGLGLIAESILKNPGNRVERITIIESSADVIRLVGRYLQDRYGERISIINADAFTWCPESDQRFSVGWHDIWPDPNGQEVQKQMEKLEKRYEPWCDWQGFWPRAYIRAALSVE